MCVGMYVVAMLINVEFLPLMLSVLMLGVAIKSIMLNDFTLSFVMLCVIM